MAFLALAAGWLCGCGMEVAGKGGSELPGPIQIVVISNKGTSSLAGMKWRLWAQSDTSASLLARGTVQSDTQGSFMIPNQSGTWVLEGWKSGMPKRVAVRTNLSGSIPGPCIDSFASADSIAPTHVCTTLVSPSGSSSHPDRISVVRLRNGLSPIRLNLYNSEGTASLAVQQIRLWKLTTGDSLAFVGMLPINAAGQMLLPRPAVSTWYLLEGWSDATSAPEEVSELQPLPDGWFRYLKCLEMPALPTTDTPISIHSCPDLLLSPSLLGNSGSKAPDIWSAFELAP
jgi:hypothetical protein